MELLCTFCLQSISARSGQRLPPWCPKCGADLKDAAPVPQDPAAPDAAQQEWVAKNLRERFTKHNFGVGLLLAAWGLLLGVGGQPSNLDKLLRLQPGLPTLVTVLQWVVLVNGGLLFFSGLAVRAHRPW